MRWIWIDRTDPRDMTKRVDRVMDTWQDTTGLCQCLILNGEVFRRITDTRMTKESGWNGRERNEMVEGDLFGT